jgi:CBS domain containing-hemolysin-like protein
MDASIPAKILLIVGLIVANAFFVAAEFALLRVRRGRVEELAGSGDRVAASVERALRGLDRAISGTQIGISASAIALGWFGEPIVAGGLESAFVLLGLRLPGAVLHAIALALAFSLIVSLYLLLGDLLPRIAAFDRPDAISRLVAIPLNGFNRLLAPAIWLLNRSAALLARAAGLHPADTRYRIHSPEEIELLVQQSLEEGVVEEDEHAMIHGVFGLTRTTVREVMTPRTDIIGAETSSDLDTVLETAAESGFSRLPVYEESLDNIIGVLLVKDLLPWLAREGRETLTARTLVREALFVPGSKPVDDLLAEFRFQKVHMAIVVDEFGGTDGIVTLEDLLEEIVGEIFDEHDVAHAELAIEADGRLLLDGGVAFSELVDRLELPSLEADYDTVAGYVIAELGRIPEVGERVQLADRALEVLELDDRRVTRIAVHPPPPEGSVEGTGDRRQDDEGES